MDPIESGSFDRQPTWPSLGTSHGDYCHCSVQSITELGLPKQVLQGITTTVDGNAITIGRLFALGSQGRLGEMFPEQRKTLEAALRRLASSACPTWLTPGVVSVGWRTYARLGAAAVADRWPDEIDGVEWSELLQGVVRDSSSNDQENVVLRLGARTLASLVWMEDRRVDEETDAFLPRPHSIDNIWDLDDVLQVLQLSRQSIGGWLDFRSAAISDLAKRLGRDRLEVLACSQYLAKCELGQIAPSQVAAWALKSYSAVDSTLDRRLHMVEVLTLEPEPEEEEAEPELLDVVDAPLPFVTPHMASAEDGGPNPLALARQLLAGGRGTRGRPPIVFTPTKLEQTLLDNLLARPQTLVVLSGNAGDGKTAFIETVLAKAETDIVAGQNEYDVSLREHRYRVVLDGSEDSIVRTNDALLDDALGEFRGDLPVEPFRGTLIAINKGRLLRFLESRREAYSFLWQVVGNQFLGRPDPAANRYLLVDLNERSVVAPDAEHSILGGIVERLSAWEAWDHECTSCDAVAVCPVRFNALSLRDESVRKRVWNIFAAVDLDDRLHVTARHVVTKLAAAVIGDLRCVDVRARVRDAVEFPPEAFIYSSLFGRQGVESQAEAAAMDRVTASYDPTENGSPRRDRRVAQSLLRDGTDELFDRHPGPDIERMSEAGAAISNSSVDDEPAPGELEYRQRVLALVRHGSRRLFMLDPGHEFAPPEPVTSQDEFLRILSGEQLVESSLPTLIDSLNATLGIAAGRFTELLAPREYADGLRGTGFAALIPMDFLQLVPATSTGRNAKTWPYLESWPRTLRLDARDSDGTLVSSIAMPLLMYEIISRANRGFRPTSQTERSYMVRLDSFYRRLADHRWNIAPVYAMYENGRVIARAQLAADTIAFSEA